MIGLILPIRALRDSLSDQSCLSPVSDHNHLITINWAIENRVYLVDSISSIVTVEEGRGSEEVVGGDPQGNF